MADIQAHPWVTRLPPRAIDGVMPAAPPSLEQIERPVASRDEIDRDILSNLCTLWSNAAEDEIVTALMSPQKTWEKVFYTLLIRYRTRNLENFNMDGEMYSPPTKKGTSAPPARLSSATDPLLQRRSNTPSAAARLPHARAGPRARSRTLPRARLRDVPRRPRRLRRRRLSADLRRPCRRPVLPVVVQTPPPRRLALLVLFPSCRREQPRLARPVWTNRTAGSEQRCSTRRPLSRRPTLLACPRSSCRRQRQTHCRRLATTITARSRRRCTSARGRRCGSSTSALARSSSPWRRHRPPRRVRRHSCLRSLASARARPCSLCKCHRSPTQRSSSS